MTQCRIEMLEQSISRPGPPVPIPRSCPTCGLGPCAKRPFPAMTLMGGGPPKTLVELLREAMEHLVHPSGVHSAQRLVQEVLKRVEQQPAEIRITTETAPADQAAHYLWGILDDIETTGEIAGNGPKADTAFRRMVDNLLSKRWNVAEIREGANTVSWKMPPPEDDTKPS